MNSPIRFNLSALLLVFTSLAQANDACHGTAITATADVTASDGKQYGVQTHYRSPYESSLSFLREDPAQLVVEGPHAWVRTPTAEQAGSDFHKLFALGHQFHALLIHFDAVMSDVVQTTLELDNRTWQARSGSIPHGGTVTLIGSDLEQPAGMRFEYPQTPVIDVRYSDWRDTGDRSLPWQITIDDGSRTFDYRFSDVSIANQSPLWFMQSVQAPALDSLQVYRLHRQLLAAHCLGDASLISERSADPSTSTDGGTLSSISRTDMHSRFTQLFDQISYTEYSDLLDPLIEIADSGDLGWVQASVRTRGFVQASGADFDHQWAWTMLVRKVDGQWLNAGTSSSRLEG